ncbi:MAG: hypothetical protein ACYSOW_10295, partial [Planctomycetota bacterium]
MDFLRFLQHELRSLEQDDLLRRCLCIDSAQGPTVRMSDGSEKVLFCSNNYLNLADNPLVKQAATEALDKYGFG